VHRAYLAHGNARHAIFHELAAATQHVESRDERLRSNPSQTAKKTRAA
jgi:hypothetical protein